MIKYYPILAKSRIQTPTPALATISAKNKSSDGTKTPLDASKEDGWQVVKYKGKASANKSNTLISQLSHNVMLEKNFSPKAQVP